MYENNNTVSIDWKGLFIKLIIVALIVFAIFKGYEYFSNKETTTSTPTTATQLFNANLESLRQAGENYYDYSNYPAEGQTVMVTLSELITKGNIKELYDANGNECNRENSYVSLTNDGGQYKLKATLSCGEAANYTIVTIGCECEGDECAQAIEKLENEKESNNSSNSTNSSNSSNKTNTSNKSNSSNSSNKTNTSNNSNSSNSSSSNTNNSVNNTTTTQKTTTTTTTTTPKTTTVKTYKVTFDSNGGDYVETQYVEKYDRAYEPDEPEKDDARFVGWYYNGKLFDFDTKITKNIKLEAYYWETRELETTVYSAVWDTIGTTQVGVSHKLAIPQRIQNKMDDNLVKNVKIVDVESKRTMTSASDLINQRNYHSTTFEGYISSSYDNLSTSAYSLGKVSYIRVGKENYGEYDRWMRWTANVHTQCTQPFYVDGVAKCNYGIVYEVVWEYDILTD